MVRAGEDTQIAHLLAAERPAGDHSLHRLFKNTHGETACQPLVVAGFLAAAGIAGGAIIDLLRQLLPGEQHLFREDDDDIVTASELWVYDRIVLAAVDCGGVYCSAVGT